MATTIKLKNGSGAPLAGDLVQGEPAFDLTNKRLYTENAGGTVIEIGTSPSTIDINAGTIDGTVIGGSSAAAGTFTTFTSTGIDDNATSTAITINSSGNVGIKTAPALGVDFEISNGAQYVGIDVNASYNDIQSYNRKLDINRQGNDIAFDVDTLYVDATNDRVGINVGTSPTYALDVNGDIGFSAEGNQLIWPTSGAPTISITSGDTYISNALEIVSDNGFHVSAGTSSMTLDDTATTYFDLTVNSNTALYANSSGNVGIGTTSPDSILHIRSAVPTLTFDDSNFATRKAKITADDGNLVLESDHLNSANSSVMAFKIDGSERMRIDSSGRVGIGTSSPTNNLDIGFADLSSGSIGFRSSTYSQIAKIVGSHDSGTAEGSLRFHTRSGGSEPERMRITSAGDVNVNGSASNLLTTSGRGIISVDGTSDSAMEIKSAGTTRGYLYAQATEFRLAAHTAIPLTFFTNATERMRIDSSGRLLVGKTSTAFGTSGVEASASNGLWSTRSSLPPLALNRLTSDGSIVDFYKDGTTVGSIGTNSGYIYIANNDGDGMALQNNSFRPATDTGANQDNIIDLGLLASRFDDVYATNGTIQTSDANEKQDIEALSEAETRVAVAAKALLRKFRWKSAVEEKGDEARVHFGIIAQDLKAAFEAEGLDAGRYAMFIHSTWTDEETGEERSRMGVRYSELLAFIIAAI